MGDKTVEARDRRIAELEEAMITMARGRKPCASGTQRISRDEMKEVARTLCAKLGIDWSPRQKAEA